MRINATNVCLLKTFDKDILKLPTAANDKQFPDLQATIISNRKLKFLLKTMILFEIRSTKIMRFNSTTNVAGQSGSK